MAKRVWQFPHPSLQRCPVYAVLMLMGFHIVHIVAFVRNPSKPFFPEQRPKGYLLSRCTKPPLGGFSSALSLAVGRTGLLGMHGCCLI